MAVTDFCEQLRIIVDSVKSAVLPLILLKTSHHLPFPHPRPPWLSLDVLLISSQGLWYGHGRERTSFTPWAGAPLKTTKSWVALLPLLSFLFSLWCRTTGVPLRKSQNWSFLLCKLASSLLKGRSRGRYRWNAVLFPWTMEKVSYLS